MLEMREALSAFTYALEREIEEVAANDIVIVFEPTRKVAGTYLQIYYGTVEDEVRWPDGVSVKIVDGKGEEHPAEVVTSRDFDVVISTIADLEPGRAYKIKYNLAWILQAELDWIKSLNPRIKRPIAQGVLQRTDSFQLHQSPELTVQLSSALNQSQKQAIRHAVSNNLTFIWGPPGTGKSTTISEIITNFLELGKSVLFISQSNVAVDLVTKKIKDSESETIRRLVQMNRFLRTGHPQLEPLEQWVEVSPYDIAVNRDPERAHFLRTLVKLQKQLLEELQKGEDVGQSLKQASDVIQRIRNELRNEVKMLEENARFIATTLAKLSLSEHIHSSRYDAVIVDEASMMGIPGVFAALTTARHHGVLAGDFYQLQPICTSDHAAVRRWLGESVFNSSGIRDRVRAGNNDPRLVILDTQYRMADDISKVINALFYGGILRDGPGEKRPVLTTQELHFENRLVFIDVSDLVQCYRAPGGQSRVNPQLAQYSAGFARQYLDKGFPVSIITPYRAQAREIRRHFSREELSHEVQVSTVHKFQGSEQEIVIFEIADSQPQTKPSVLISGSREGFINSNSPTLPLVNVALSRARSQIILMADRKFLRGRLTDSNIVLAALRCFEQMGVVVNVQTREISLPKKSSSKDTELQNQEPETSFDAVKAREYFKCTQCEGLMVLRKGRRGYFLGCTSYPYCENTRPFREEDLVTLLLLNEVRCRVCYGPVTGQLNWNWVTLRCVECGQAYDKKQIGRALSL